MRLLLDTGVLGRLCHRNQAQYLPLRKRLWGFLNAVPNGRTILIPEIADYELRRKLLHLSASGRAPIESLHRLDDAAAEFEYLALDTETMQLAAQLWSQARLSGLATAHDIALDADVILAAQAQRAGGIVVTTNRKHLSRFVTALDWTEIPSS